MNILVTAGNTQTPIDKVRCLTNIFSGKTGARIAIEAVRRGHNVTHFNSHPEVIPETAGKMSLSADRWQFHKYRTFDDLSLLMETRIPNGGFDVIIHAAAVSDYSLGGVYAKNERGDLIDVAAGKVKSHHPELWLKMLPTPKLIDRIRHEWGFRGILVKFKLEVGLSDEELLIVAEKARVQSEADLMVANTLEGMSAYAYLGPLAQRYEKVERGVLPSRLLDAVENLKLEK
jgi:phosphopantothenate-cysteine ligase/phosphopantothenoylcysteine decarboxylase/phosphopantothenate--cysteine ligase